MAAAALKGWAWGLAALVSTGFIVALSLHGERPSLLHEASENGVMRELNPIRVRWVEVRTPEGRWRFERGGRGWQTTEAAASPPPDFAKQVDLGLRLLHDSAPERLMAANEVAGHDPAEFGLAQPTLTVALGDAKATLFTAAFGRANPMGLANYVRIEGRAGLVLLNDYVLDTWKQAVGAR